MWLFCAGWADECYGRLGESTKVEALCCVSKKQDETRRRVCWRQGTATLLGSLLVATQAQLTFCAYDAIQSALLSPSPGLRHLLIYATLARLSYFVVALHTVDIWVLTQPAVKAQSLDE